MTSIRSRALKSFEDDKAKRDRIRAIIDGDVSLVDGKLSAADLDAEHALAPYENRKAFLYPLYPTQLAITVAKNAALKGLTMLAEPDAPKLPLGDNVEMAKFCADVLAKPVAKDLAISLLTRAYERVAESHYSGDGSDFERGKWTRDVSMAAKQAAFVRNAFRENEASRGLRTSAVEARWDVSAHVATSVVWRPALIANLAILTVEEADLLLTYLWRLYRKRRAEAVLVDRASTPARKSKARDELTLVDEELKAAAKALAAKGGLLGELVLNCVRAGSAVLAEVLLGGVGTLLRPGFGTVVGDTVGSVVTWLLI